MQIRTLETLVKIHEVQSFSRSAELQNITLSALSMQMKSLETQLDAQLFDRIFRPPKLTPLGQDVALQAKEVLKQFYKLTDLCGSEKELSGRFQLGVISSVAVRMIPRFISEFAQSTPRAKFDVSTGLSEDLCNQVQLGQLDGALVTRVAGAPQDLHFDALCQEAMIYAVPKALGHQSLGELSVSLPFIHFRPSTGIGNLIANHLRSSVSRPNKTIVLDNLETCMEFVKQGLGYTLLPEPDVRKWMDDNVQIIEDSQHGMFRELALVSRTEHFDLRWNTEILKVFKSLVQETQEKSPDFSKSK